MFKFGFIPPQTLQDMGGDDAAASAPAQPGSPIAHPLGIPATPGGPGGPGADGQMNPDVMSSIGHFIGSHGGTQIMSAIASLFGG